VQLKLTHHRYHEASQGVALAAPEPVGNEFESPAMRRVLERLAKHPGQHVLDVGVLCGGTIVSLAEAGARVYVYDLITPLLAQLDADGKPDMDRLLHPIDLPPGSVDVVCLWDLPDMLEPAAAARLIQRVERWLAPGGEVVAQFHISRGDRVHRFRLGGGGRVQMELVTERPGVIRATHNNQIVELLRGMTIRHSSLLRTQMREMLARKGG